MGSSLDDLDGHEGYGARRLADGTLSTTWSAATACSDAHVAACSCGWQGGGHPPTEAGYEAALDEWDAEHARPLLALTVPAEVADAVAAAKDALARLTTERPAAALRALDDLGRWADRRRQGIDVGPTAPGVEQPGGQDAVRRESRRRRAIGR